MSENRVNSQINDLNVESFDDSEDMKLTEISLSVNAWITKSCADFQEFDADFDLSKWMSDETIVSVYFLAKNSVKFNLFMKCKVSDGKSVIKLTIGHKTRLVQIKGNQSYQWFSVGKFRIIGSGYTKIDLQGIEKSGPYFADISHLMFVYKLVESKPNPIKFIADIDQNHTYWSRRGPSVHLVYDFERSEDEYYYNEVTVPQQYDPIGSYFAAIGFNNGYFGIQVNSETERRVLFSVWSPQQTDDPNQLFDENRVQLIDKSDDIEYNTFGGEGCGGQSILRYNWSPEITYRFLVRGKPDSNQPNYSEYTAWFSSEKDSTWKLIASFRRPKSGQYLSDFYSFVENFIENTSFQIRKAFYGNQWIRNSSGVWRSVTRARLTGDDSAQNNVRLDFDGGIQTREDGSQQFYLQNCGFFVGKTPLNTILERNENLIEPQIDLTQL